MQVIIDWASGNEDLSPFFITFTWSSMCWAGMESRGQEASTALTTLQMAVCHKAWPVGAVSSFVLLIH